MRISVIIPVYNVTQFLDEAIRSAVMQNYPELETVVVDDGSAPERREEIAEICRRYPSVTYCHQPHLGAAAARDFGVAQTAADCIVFLDADDVLAPGALSFFSTAMERLPEAIAVYGRVVNTDEDGQPTGGLQPVAAWIAPGAEVLEFLLERKPPFCNGSI